MKKSLISVALMAMAGLMTAGLAHADTTTSNPQPNDRNAWAGECTFSSTGCTADTRIVFSGDRNVSPQWFGTLLAVNCHGELISASDAILYRLTGDPHDYRYQLDNSDATVHILMKDHPFHDGGPNTVTAKLRIDGGSDTGSCTFVRLHH